MTYSYIYDCIIYKILSTMRMNNESNSNRESVIQPFQVQQRIAVTYKNICNLIIKVIILCFSPFYFGYCLTYLSTFSNEMIVSIYGQLAGHTSFNSVLIGVSLVGAMFGAGSAPFLMKCLTRKQFILVINLFALIIEGIIQIPNPYVLLACRIMQGYFIGNYMAIVPIYINELAPKQIVGSFGVFTQLFVVIALVYSYGIGLAMEVTQVDNQTFYRVMVTMNAFFIIVQSLALIFNFVPESPNSLIKKNKMQEAKEVIGLFLLSEYIEQVYEQKVKQIAVQLGQVQQQTKIQIKFHWSAYLLGFQLPFMQQMTGINAVVTSARTIVGNIIPSLAMYVPLIINAVQLVATISTIFVLTRVGRKSLTLFGNLGLAVIDIAIGILFIFSDWGPSGIIIFVLLILYMIVYGISLGPVVWLYVPEIIPAKIVPFATVMNWFGASICVICTPIAISDYNGNPFPVFFFFGGITMIFFLMNTLLMKQTKGLTTTQIALMFNKKNQKYVQTGKIIDDQ